MFNRLGYGRWRIPYRLQRGVKLGYECNRYLLCSNSSFDSMYMTQWYACHNPNQGSPSHIRSTDEQNKIQKIIMLNYSTDSVTLQTKADFLIVQNITHCLLGYSMAAHI